MEDSGILSQPELPTTTLNITDDVLKEIEKCFTHTAYRKIWKSGRLMHWVKILRCNIIEVKAACGPGAKYFPMVQICILETDQPSCRAKQIMLGTILCSLSAAVKTPLPHGQADSKGMQVQLLND